MPSVIAKRLVAVPPTLFGVLLLTFIFLQVIPGNPVERMIGERGVSAERKAIIMAHYGLNKPVLERFALYLYKLSRGDFGLIPGTGRSVLDEFTDRLPNTIRLAFTAFLISAVLGLSTGIAAGLRPGSFVDTLCRIFSTIGQSTPVFWSGLVAMYVLAYRFRIFPPSGDGGGGLAHLVLPALTLGVRPAAFLQRIVRSSLLEIMGRDFIRTARAKGLSEWAVISRHALRNAAIPVVTIMAVDLGSLLSGSVITESVFHYRGVGAFILYGIRNRVYPVVLLSALFTTCLFLTVNMLTDILYVILDPRLGTTGRGR